MMRLSSFCVAAVGLSSVNTIRVIKKDTSGSDADSSKCIGDKSQFRSSIDKLLAEREGFGEDTIGGRDGDVFVVSSTSDDSSGCTLRNALEGSSAPRWIVFDSSMSGATIKLTKKLRPVGGYKTVDGRGRDVTIRGWPRSDKNCTVGTALDIRNQKHIIINDVTFDGNLADWDRDDECADAIFVQETNFVWIHHNDFLHWPDAAVEVRVGNDNVTLNKKVSITYNKVKEIYQAFVMSAEQLTFANNFCNRVRRRCIKVVNGKSHSFNNVIKDWTDRSIQNVMDNGQLYSQQNVFKSDGYKDANKLKPDARIRCEGNHASGIRWCDSSGSCGTGKSCSQNSISSSFRSDSQSNVKKIRTCAEGDSTCVDSLYRSIRDTAGVRG